MRNLLYTIVLILLPNLVLAQTNSENYIKNITYKVETVNGKHKAGTTTNLDPKDVITGVTYYSGLGRPKQSIVKQAGGGKEDIITPIVYDNLGRQVKNYLPMARSNSSLNYEAQNNQFFTNLEAYYVNTFPEDLNMSSPNPYSETVFEASPLNRVLEQASPGKDWAVNSSNTIKFVYQTNAFVSGNPNNVRQFSVTHPSNNTEKTQLAFQDYYPAGQLYKTITKDENWKLNQQHEKDHTTEEFKNKQGQVILKRTYDKNKLHDTYYVYDDFGNLTYVMPPEASSQITNSGAISSTVLDELCYVYHYDHRNRLIEKKIPGKGWEFIVYDTLDRPVLTQDANLRIQNDWLFTKYDVHGRVVYTGKYHFVPPGSEQNSGRKKLQEIITAQGANNHEVRAQKTIDGVVLNHSNNIVPKDNIEIYTISYYDTYPSDITGASSGGEFNNPNSVIINGKTVQTVTNTKTLPTGNRVRVLGTEKWITTASYFDDKARPIYAVSINNYLNTLDAIIVAYDFVGNVLETKNTHKKTNQPTIITINKFSYDHAGRLLTEKQKINNTPEELITKNAYDELGQLIAKNVGGVEAAPLQVVNYTYNIRGWLKQINDVDALGADLFGFGINYNTSDYGAQKLFNGNISETVWKTKSITTIPNGSHSRVETELKRAYAYGYDALNRIKSGAYLEENTQANNRDGLYNLKGVDYDKNGNIIELSRSGSDDLGNKLLQMDALTYSYKGNQLTGVTELGNKQYGFSERTTAQTIDYVYDGNGNMIKDRNKDIYQINYNHLNLPTYIYFDFNNNGLKDSENGITYIYDATGNKLEKLVLDNNEPTRTKYAGNFIYEEKANDEELKFFSHSEGYVEPNNLGNFDYIYQYKDHLGNIRLSYKNTGSVSTKVLEIVEENNYYPFGLKHKGYNGFKSSTNIALKRKFGGKEYQDELGLGWYDVSARNYDPALGRWMNLDPLAEKMRRHSPYNYAFNNPIYFVDPDGMAPLANDCCGGWNPVSGIGDGIARAFESASNKVISFLGLDKIEPVLEASGDATLGLQAGFNIKAGAVGVDVDVNAINFELVSGQADLTDPLSPDSYTGDHIGKNGDAKFSHSIGATADVVGYPVVGGDISATYRSEGDATVDGGLYFVAPLTKTKSRSGGSNTSSMNVPNGPSSDAKTGKQDNFYGVNIGAGATLGLGLNVNLKIGINVND
ncbi:RHS repeat-associated core domain-containing protein [Bizionia argentinensis JUB59]|uniref:RHS repeat-associated core domain-containing protein n=1 Tax=Bizionia argentinensis JUB59 TaxID=1046627 RepID=G2EGZ0_9FLAO|nr:DUF6443 domain-containing protein [Bizionia argentinensis]EGV42093.1 RHS repeat-associated core domain-containing protein [Bizionia argentinensis JUB59]